MRGRWVGFGLWSSCDRRRFTFGHGWPWMTRLGVDDGEVVQVCTRRGVWVHEGQSHGFGLAKHGLVRG